MLIVRFNEYFKLVVTAFIISFLLYPLCKLLNKRLKISWRLAAVIVYLLIAGLVLWLITSAGSTIVAQAQNLFENLTKNVGGLTTFLETWSNRVINVGPLKFIYSNWTRMSYRKPSPVIFSQLQPKRQKVVGLSGLFPV